MSIIVTYLLREADCYATPVGRRASYVGDAGISEEAGVRNVVWDSADAGGHRNCLLGVASCSTSAFLQLFDYCERLLSEQSLCSCIQSLPLYSDFPMTNVRVDVALMAILTVAMRLIVFVAALLSSKTALYKLYTLFYFLQNYTN
jgi:hypothetical protein